MNILCLDYGTKRIGVAFSSTPLAEPLEIIANPTKDATQVITPQAMTTLTKLIDTLSIDSIVVGISEEQMASKTRQFIELLKEVTVVPIEEMDETLSSFQTFAQMRQMKKSKRDGHRDHYAAANILQNYLDTHGTEMVD